MYATAWDNQAAWFKTVYKSPGIFSLTTWGTTWANNTGFEAVWVNTERHQSCQYVRGFISYSSEGSVTETLKGSTMLSDKVVVIGKPGSLIKAGAYGPPHIRSGGFLIL
jgi:hypothetical protein